MTQEIALEWWSYDPFTGIVVWKKWPGTNVVKVGQEAGIYLKSQSGKTYRILRLKGHGTPLAHRVIWLMVTGHWPTPSEEIDHEDGNGLHNWWSNLRLVSHAEQAKNHRVREGSTTGAVGVTFKKGRGKYMARVTVNRKEIYLGLFPRLEDAIAARKAASEKHGFHPNHGQERPL